jgi:predicted amidophosphoribosyltransferase
MESNLHRARLRLFDLLVPERCAACGAGELIVCSSCLAALRLLRGPLCARCGASTAWPVARCAECAGRRISFAQARAAVSYDGPARTLVAAWKERGRRSLGRTFAGLVVEVVPCPPVEGWRLSRATVTGASGAGRTPRRSSRARSGESGVSLSSGCSGGRGRYGLSEDCLARRGRANVRGAFSAARAPAAVALIDDVYTTGATVSAAATELRRAGARAVFVVTFARAARR